jgi:hypothetical protein
LLFAGVIKSGTSVPAKVSEVMPVTPFMSLFYKLGDNVTMSLKMLRLKTVASLALTLMLRPSDIAPRSTVFDPATNSTKARIFSSSHVHFKDSAVMITFHGIKNDTSRSGFTVTLRSA